MSTSKRYWQRGLSLAAILLATSALAEGFSLSVINPACQISQYAKDRNRFVKTTRKLEQFSKFKIAGKPLPQSAAITVFMVEGNVSGQLFAVNSSCVKYGPAYVPPKVKTMDIGPAAPTGPFASRLRPGETGLKELRSTYFTFAFMSWQEGFDIHRSAADLGGPLDIPILATAMAIAPGIGFYVVKNPRFQMAWDTNGFFGVANVGKKSDSDETGTDYSGKGIAVFGGMTGPSFLFSHSQTLAAGVEIPIAFRKAMWANPNVANWTADSKFSVYPIYLFTTQWRGEKWAFVQKIGIQKTWPGYFWSLQMNRNF